MVTIRRNPNGDTRTAPKDVSYEEFQQANDMHIEDVKSVMRDIAAAMMYKGAKHDWTKKMYEEVFYRDFKDTIDNGTDFIKSPWYKLHVEEEAHHPLADCHDDITLLDIIEMIADCVCAGKARSGEIRELEISDDILKKAFNNTVKLIDNMTELEELK